MLEAARFFRRRQRIEKFRDCFRIVGHARGRQDELHSVACDTEFVQQSANEQCHFSAGRAFIHVRLVDHEQQFV